MRSFDLPIGNMLDGKLDCDRFIARGAGKRPFRTNVKLYDKKLAHFDIDVGKDNRGSFYAAIVALSVSGIPQSPFGTFESGIPFPKAFDARVTHYGYFLDSFASIPSGE